MRVFSTKNRGLLWIATILLLLGGALRIIGMAWGLPYQLHPDEPVLFINAWERWDTGAASLQKDYPLFYIYMLVAQREFVYRIFGADTPQVVYFFFARWNSILISLLLIAAAYRTGQQAGGWRVGVAFGLFMAVEPISALDQGWIIKADNMAWLCAMLTLWGTLKAVQRRAWRWLGAAVVFGILAAVAKYNIVVILFAPLFGLIRLLTKRDWLALAISLISILAITFLGWSIVRAFWTDQIEPAFWYCDPWYVEQHAAQGEYPNALRQSLLCPPYQAFQRFLGPFYHRSEFIDGTTQHIFESMLSKLRLEFGVWREVIIAGLLALLFSSPTSRRRRQAALMAAAVVLPTMFLFSLFGLDHAIRQYYPVVLGIGLWLAVGLAHLGEKQPKLYFLLLAVLFIPYIWNGLEHRLELRQPDTRAVTADYLLSHARRGEAVVVEYDHVEFAPQYGGFPEADGYFKIIGVEGIYDLEVDRLFQQGIYYVVADWRAAYAPTSYYRNRDRIPPKFEVALDLTDDQYTGPKRLIFRTFRPQGALHATFDRAAYLLGYDLALEGTTLRLKLYWQSLADHLPPYSVFVHVVDAATGEKAAQRDAPPQRGTDQWERYEWVFDEREIPLAGIPTGDYSIHLGIYDPVIGSRLAVNGDPTGVLELPEFHFEN